MRTQAMRGVLRASAIALLCFFVLLSGCSEKEGGQRVAGIPPDTFISYGPKEATMTYYRVQAYWYGADDDGDVEYYEVTTVRNVSRADLDNLDLPDSVWTVTFEQQGTFVLPADSCCLDSIENPAQTPQFAKGLWGILVRAVDNEGLKDPTPDALFFTATNIVPKVAIVVPEETVWGFRTMPPHPYVEWAGEDADGDPAALEYKFIVIPEDSLNDVYPKLPPLDYVDRNVQGHASPELGKWSDWVPADCTYVKDLDLTSWVGAGLDHPINVFVTVKDEGGAYLPENLYGNKYNKGANSIKLVIISTGDGVKIKLSGGSLGVRQSGQESQYKNNIAGLFQGTEISFVFWGVEEKARGEIAEAYRYYYDNPDDPTSAWNYWTSTAPIRDPGAPGGREWIVRYPPDGSQFAPTLGRHVFVVEVRDVNTVVTHCEFNIEVLEGPRRLTEQKILLVDDDLGAYFEELPMGFEDTQLDFWESALDGYNWELFGTGTSYGTDVPIRSIGSATTVIWLADEDIENPATQLLEVCTEKGNYLYSYVKVGGNLIIIGRDPVSACCYWSTWQEYEPRPSSRSRFTRLVFAPDAPDETHEDTLYNFMWDIFGIEEVKRPSKQIPFNMIWHCVSCGDAWEDTIPALPAAGSWRGQFNSAFYITSIRDTDGEPRAPVVEAMYSTAYDSSGVITPTEENLIAVFAKPGLEQNVRGSAAYIGFPAEWFDHEDMKALIRKILTEFGETSE